MITPDSYVGVQGSLVMKRFVMFTAMLMAAVLPMELLTQTADYNKVIAQAKADLAGGHNAEALAGTQRAIQIDTSRWEAYLVAGSALENQKQFDPAVDNYTKALERAPEPKKAAVRDLLEQCKKLGAASSPAVSMPAATVQGPPFKETIDWLISKNAQEGFTEGIGQPPFAPITLYRFRSDFVSYPFDSSSGGVQCMATLQGNGLGSNFATDNAISINFSQLASNSIGLKRVNIRNLMPPPEGAQVFTFPQGEVYFQVTGLRPFLNTATDSELQQLAAAGKLEFNFTTSIRAPIYSDQDLANRVAKALNHAIDVCADKPKSEGSGKPEVF